MPSQGPSTLRSILKRKNTRAISGRNRKGFPSRGRFAAFLVPVPVPLVVSLPDALACESVAACESILACRFGWFEDQHGQASLGYTECLRRSRASALPSCGGTCGMNGTAHGSLGMLLRSGEWLMPQDIDVTKRFVSKHEAPASEVREGETPVESSDAHP